MRGGVQSSTAQTNFLVSIFPPNLAPPLTQSRRTFPNDYRRVFAIFREMKMVEHKAFRLRDFPEIPFSSHSPLFVSLLSGVELSQSGLTLRAQRKGSTNE